MLSKRNTTIRSPRQALQLVIHIYRLLLPTTANGLSVAVPISDRIKECYQKSTPLDSGLAKSHFTSRCIPNTFTLPRTTKDLHGVYSNSTVFLGIRTRGEPALSSLLGNLLRAVPEAQILQIDPDFSVFEIVVLRILVYSTC